MSKILCLSLLSSYVRHHHHSAFIKEQHVHVV